MATPLLAIYKFAQIVFCQSEACLLPERFNMIDMMENSSTSSEVVQPRLCCADGIVPEAARVLSLMGAQVRGGWTDGARWEQETVQIY